MAARLWAFGYHLARRMSIRRPDSTDPGGLDAARPEVPRPEDERLKRHIAALIEGLPQLVWLSADGGQWTWSSPHWTSYTGLDARASRGLGWYDAVHPDDRAQVQAAWEVAITRGVLDVEHRLFDRDGGEARWFRTHGTPVSADPGQPREWLGTCTDVHQTRWLEERERLLSAEMRQRVRDSLALTRLVARRTAKTSATAEEFASHLEGRLDAIARAQLFAADNPEAGVDLERLVTEEALAHAAMLDGQLRIDGPAFILSAKAAGWFGLALHELMANAVKYGALSVPGGWVDVSWRVEGAWSGKVLRFEWREGGMPPAQEPPSRRGFGTELIERTLERELGGSASLGFGHDGARCTILLPLVAGVSVSAGRSRS